MKSLKKNFTYIWDYYKVPILAVPLLLLVIAYFIAGFSGSKEEPFYLYFINQPLSEEVRTQFETDFSSFWDETGDVDGISVDASLTITPDTPDYDSQMSFTASIAGHTIDVMIANEAFLDYYAKMDSLADLSELLPEDLYDALIPYLVMKEDESGIPHAYGLNVSDCPALSALHLDKPILTVAKFSEHRDADISFIRYLFGK